MANDEEIQVLLTADDTDLAAAMQDGAESVTQATQTMSDAVADSAAVMTKSYEDIIAAQNAQMTQVSASMAVEDAAAAVRLKTAAGIATETEAVEANTAATAINGGVAREVGVLIGELARGNYTRLEGSSVTLANRTGLLTAAFSPLGLAIIAAGSAVGFTLDQMIKGEERASAFSAALLSTGNASGMSSDQLQSAADKIAAFSGDADGADAIVLKLAQSGKLSGDALVNAGTAAANIMRLTGESAQEAAKQVESLSGNPAQAVVELNNKFHFLTVELYDQIVALQKNGQAYDATALAAKAFADDTSERIQKLNENMGYFEEMASHMKEGWSTIDQAMQKALDPTLMQKADLETHLWFVEQEKLTQAIKDGASPSTIAYLTNLTGVYKQSAQALHAQARAQDDANASAGKAADKAAGVIQEEQEQEKLNAKLRDTSILQEKIAEAKKLAESIHADDPNSAAIKGITFDSAGLVSGGEQWAAELQKITKEYGQTGDASRKAEAEQRKASAEAMNDLEIQRAATDQYSQARMADDDKIVAKALQLYGKDSSQYKAALDQKKRDQDDFNKQTLQSNLELLDQKKTEYDKDNENQKGQYELAFEQGKINATQLAALERQLVQDKLLADTAYLTAKENLDVAAGASGVHQAQAEAQAIIAIKQQAQTDLTKIDQEYMKNSQKDWNGYESSIASGMKSAFTGMLFQGNTFKQGMASLGQSIAGTFIDKTVDNMLKSFVEGQSAQTAAAAAGGSTRLAIQEADTKAGMTISAAMNESQIENAASTGAAQAYSAVAGIPIVGPILAPIAAGVAFAGIMAFDNIASAAGGWENIPADQLAMVHKNEMVMPAHLAEGIRGMVSSAGNSGAGGGSQGGGDTHIHINVQAIDAKLFQTALRGGLGAQLAQYVKQKTANMPQARR
jgi:hypothetical protein